MAADDIVTLAQAKTFLNITGTTFDVELAEYVTSASQMWLARGGPGAGSPAYDEWHDGGGSTVVLNHRPVLAISAITEASGMSTSTLTAQDAGGSGSDGYSLDKVTGVIVRRSGGEASTFASGVKNVHVQYTAGYTTAPKDVEHAVLLLIWHLWETQRGGSKRPGSNSDEYAPAGSTYSWPRRVEEIFQAHVVPGIA